MASIAMTMKAERFEVGQRKLRTIQRRLLDLKPGERSERFWLESRAMGIACRYLTDLQVALIQCGLLWRAR